MDANWEEHMRRMAHERNETRQRATTMLRALLQGGGYIPMAVDLGLQDALADTSELRGFGKLPMGDVFFSVEMVAYLLGKMPISEILALTESGEHGFPPPARGSGPKDWLWSQGEISIFVEELPRYGAGGKKARQ